MPTEPLVCAIMLTRDRPQMAARAVAAFRAQAYERKRLAILDSSAERNADMDGSAENGSGILYGHSMEFRWFPIGSLRNFVNGSLKEPTKPIFGVPDIIIHWDDDDLSHPNRIAEQVALLQSSGADAVGYNEVLFWREPRGPHDVDPMERTTPALPGEAWLYSNRSPAYAVGASLCYWRKTWERHPFPAMQVGEDRTFLQSIRNAGGRVVGVTAMPFVATPGCGESERATMANHNIPFQPRLIQSLHGLNTSAAVDPASDNWRRVPEWDAYAKDKTKL